MKIIQGVTYQIRYESVPELAPNAVSVVDLNADSMSQFYSIRRPSSIEIMVEEEPLPPTERFDSPFIGHRVLLPSGQQELVSSLRCIFSSCIRMRVPVYVQGDTNQLVTNTKLTDLFEILKRDIFSSSVVFIDNNQIPRNP